MMTPIDDASHKQTMRRVSITEWFNRTRYGWLWGLLVVGLLLRMLLILFSPQPFGYVYDLYHLAIEFFDQTGRLPRAEDLWQGYHPPLYYALGLLFYRLGKPWGAGLMTLTMLSMISGLVTIYYSIGVLRLYRQRGLELVLGAALIWSFPCLFISSWGAEADILLTALMTAFFYYLVIYHLLPYRAGWRLATVLGALAGLAAATKYSGLIALVMGGAITGLRVIMGPRRLAATRDGLLILALAVAIGGWKYFDNYTHYHTPLYANGTAVEGFTVAHRPPSNWSFYNYSSLHLGQALKLMTKDPPRGQLTGQPVYREIWTTLHTMCWSDMSFFSEGSRHGAGGKFYGWRNIPPWLTGSVLYLGLVPVALALLGLRLAMDQRRCWPVVLWVGMTLVVYLYWVTAQREWALKTKYILFILPAWAMAVLMGLRWTQRKLPRPLRFIPTLLLGALAVLAHLYLLRFAVGDL